MGKQAMVLQEMNTLSMLIGAAREGLQRLFKRPLENYPVKVHTVPPAYHLKT